MSSLIEQITAFGIGLRHPKDPFFSEGNAVCKATERQGVFDVDEEELCHKGSDHFGCSVPGCKAEFESVMAFEMHYNSQHRNPCSVCKKQFPSAHLLDLHVLESHDSFFQVQAERKPMFSCFVEDCVKKFQSPKERQDHCISEHKFPHDFRFGGFYKDPLSSKKKAKKVVVENMQQGGEPMEEDVAATESAPKPAGKKVFLGKGKRGRMWHSQDQRKANGSSSNVQFDAVTKDLRENLPDDEMTG